jgi:two-component system KDP operon response regulator KdpE
MRVLIAEDELATRKMLRFVFEQQAGHSVDEAESGGQALGKLDEQPFDLLLTDLSLPDLDGLELIRRVRRVSSIPIMIVSARTAIPERVRGLKSGADDYVVKPFDVTELLARADALLWRARRVPKLEGGLLSAGDLTLEPGQQVVDVRGGVRVRLTPNEYRVLYRLARSPGQLVTRAELEAVLADGPSEDAPGGLNTYISTLRHKLETDPDNPSLIETVRGRGYRLAV